MTTKDPLLQPYQLKHLTLRNRIMSTSHEPAYSEDGLPKQHGPKHGGQKKPKSDQNQTAPISVVLTQQTAWLVDAPKKCCRVEIAKPKTANGGHERNDG